MTPAPTSTPAEIAQQLIRFNTSNPPGNEEKCIAYAGDLLSKVGITTQVYARSAKRPNLVVKLPGRGEGPPLLLFGHVDVVPADNRGWMHPPFEGKLADGYLWGRGALDMKSGVAMMLSALLQAKATRRQPRNRLWDA